MNDIPLFWSKNYLRSLKFESILLSLDIFTGSIRELDLAIDFQNPSECEFLLGGQIIDGCFISYKAGSFGGIYSKNGWRDNDFLEKCLSYLQSNYSIQNFYMKLPSNHLMRFDSLLQIQSLLNLGFKINFVDFNYSITVETWCIENMSRNRIRNLRKAISSGFYFSKLNLEAFDLIYELLEKNRKLKNVSLSLTKNELFDLCAKFPENYFLFGVYHEEVLISAAVVVVTHSSNLYVFYWADDFEYRRYSPVTFLFTELVKYALEKGYENLDLGTVGQNGTYDLNLASFKQSLGASLSFKYSLSLTTD
jgi:hypothetical protein